MSEHLGNLMQDTVEKIRQVVDADTVMGKPVTTPDGTTIIPVSRVSFGFGAGGGDHVSKHAKEDGPVCFGGGGGGGVTVSPICFVVVDQNGARVLPLNAQASTTADRLVELLPDAVSKIASLVHSREEEPAEMPEDDA